LNFNKKSTTVRGKVANN